MNGLGIRFPHDEAVIPGGKARAKDAEKVRAARIAAAGAAFGRQRAEVRQSSSAQSFETAALGDRAPRRSSPLGKARCS